MRYVLIDLTSNAAGFGDSVFRLGPEYTDQQWRRPTTPFNKPSSHPTCLLPLQSPWRALRRNS